ncbi:twin-arginine translocase TatA/TatE family subunit [Desulfobacca acetoxidans]|uniref:Sec-independent protein translocase protein TatA n=1 Tax=Desulfobacca acetoxidans (strain ATCC 700848 / DSM 11109 / ASRB2) TaxID=880072 RepID=F2NDQ8_DESAR|nr:twin-arginine translocase TatA/TatE family subunit [Desulfobacca acetoxidans]AEB10405.1 Sec-independent protein translocase protein tatA/E-like protein [Desulfobacca acetoxidans DSM 11109]HAY23049.1 twin-arginine translocase TatA/TatE family subunit [Desulfobacterales bacterium]
MFGYNITTLIIILVIALLLFGPKRLPELGDSIGKAIRGFKKASEAEPEPLPSAEAKASPATGSQTVTAVKLCPQCQKELGGDFAFCPHCGHKVKEAGNG